LNGCLTVLTRFQIPISGLAIHFPTARRISDDARVGCDSQARTRQLV
jgi:hypothetical protein